VQDTIYEMNTIGKMEEEVNDATKTLKYSINYQQASQQHVNESPRLASEMGAPKNFKQPRVNASVPRSMMNNRRDQKYVESIRSQELKPSYKRNVMSPDAVPTSNEMIQSVARKMMFQN